MTAMTAYFPVGMAFVCAGCLVLLAALFVIREWQNVGREFDDERK